MSKMSRQDFQLIARTLRNMPHGGNSGRGQRLTATRWMIACDGRNEPPTFPNRTAAARAERELMRERGELV